MPYSIVHGCACESLDCENNIIVSRYLQLMSLMLLFISFGRSIKGSSPHRDLDLNDNYYLMYGLGATLTTSGYTIRVHLYVDEIKIDKFSYYCAEGQGMGG